MENPKLSFGRDIKYGIKLYFTDSEAAALLTACGVADLKTVKRHSDASVIVLQKFGINRIKEVKMVPVVADITPVFSYEQLNAAVGDAYKHKMSDAQIAESLRKTFHVPESTIAKLLPKLVVAKKVELKLW